MLGPVAAGKRLRNCLSAGVATVMAQARQHLGVTLAGKDRADDPQAGRASDVGDDVVELGDSSRSAPSACAGYARPRTQAAARADARGTQLGDLAFGPKAGTQKPMRMKPLQAPLIADVGLASGHVLGIARIDKEDNKATGIEQLENWYPVNAGQFHDDGLDATFREPVHQPMQVGREGAETADWLRRAVCSLRQPCAWSPRYRWQPRSDASPASCGQFWTSICCGSFSNPPADISGRAGLRYW